MYRIFHGRHLIFLTDDKEQISQIRPDFVFKNADEKQVKEILKLTKEAATKKIKILIVGQPSQLLDDLFHSFKYVRAAGGLVFNKKGELLLMKRLGKYDLPKGKANKKEGIESCALREIEEETGAAGLTIESPFAETYHTYFRSRKWQMKHTHWFLVKCKKGKNLKPQEKENH